MKPAGGRCWYATRRYSRPSENLLLTVKVSGSPSPVIRRRVRSDRKLRHESVYVTAMKDKSLVRDAVPVSHGLVIQESDPHFVHLDVKLRYQPEDASFGISCGTDNHLKSSANNVEALPLKEDGENSDNDMFFEYEYDSILHDSNFCRMEEESGIHGDDETRVEDFSISPQMLQSAENVDKTMDNNVGKRKVGSLECDAKRKYSLLINKSEHEEGDRSAQQCVQGGGRRDSITEGHIRDVRTTEPHGTVDTVKFLHCVEEPEVTSSDVFTEVNDAVRRKGNDLPKRLLKIDKLIDKCINSDKRSRVGACGLLEGRSGKQNLETAEVPSVQTTGERKSADAVPAAADERSIGDKIKGVLSGNALGTIPSISHTDKLRRMAVTREIRAATAAERSNSQLNEGPFYGLPSKVQELLEQQRGIKHLYDWQHTCLSLEPLRQHKNLIYSLPTSGGKTLVAEVVMLQELLCRRRDALLILPYVALVQEKIRGLSVFGLELDFFVEEYAGGRGHIPPRKRHQKRSLYVGTIEKAHSLVISMLEAGRLGEIGLVVVDELHMLGEGGSRGARLEMALAKILFAAKSIQIVGMSATLSNIRDLQVFLKAEVYTNDFRPVELKEYIKLSDRIYEINSKALCPEDCCVFSRVLSVKYSRAMETMDPDHLVAMVTEVIPQFSCLVFCPTKKNCENVATMICKYLNKAFLTHKEPEKLALLKELRSDANGHLCPVLKLTIPFGVAYHHSGLTGDERRLIEEAHSAGVLSLLTCTSTLAAGVNLPARRVILRSPYVGMDFLSRTQYKQMVGRAGRAGIDSAGESIVICANKDRAKVLDLVSGSFERCQSSLLYDHGKGLRSLLLSLVGLKVAITTRQLHAFLEGTLFGVQQRNVKETDTWEMTCDQLHQLSELGLLRPSCVEHAVAAEDRPLEITQLGQATWKASVDLSFSNILYRDLQKGLEGLALDNYLHLIYLITPYDMISRCNPDWMLYMRQFNKLNEAERRVAAAVGVMEGLITMKAIGKSCKQGFDETVATRFYLALFLYSLFRQDSIWAVAEKFRQSRGFIQNLVSSAAAFSVCVYRFCQEMKEFWAYNALFADLTQKLSYCTKTELIPLMEVAGVKEARAKQLRTAGYKTLALLANANISDLVRALEYLSQKQARQIVASAKMLLTEKVEALRDEANELLMLPEIL
uniref:helicase POLQ-like isoform X1 n=3 Tax=Myxine glutinosa TaxID=7769 RepID=UPI0035901671